MDDNINKIKYENQKIEDDKINGENNNENQKIKDDKINGENNNENQKIEYDKINGEILNNDINLKKLDTISYMEEQNKILLLQKKLEEIIDNTFDLKKLSFLLYYKLKNIDKILSAPKSEFEKIKYGNMSIKTFILSMQKSIILKGNVDDILLSGILTETTSGDLQNILNFKRKSTSQDTFKPPSLTMLYDKIDDKYWIRFLKKSNIKIDDIINTHKEYNMTYVDLNDDYFEIYTMHKNYNDFYDIIKSYAKKIVFVSFLKKFDKKNTARFYSYTLAYLYCYTANCVDLNMSVIYNRNFFGLQFTAFLFLKTNNLACIKPTDCLFSTTGERTCSTLNKGENLTIASSRGLQCTGILVGNGTSSLLETQATFKI